MEDSFHLGNALAGFLIRVNDNSTNGGMRPAHEEDQARTILPQTPRTPTRQLPSSSSITTSPFFFSELAPESEEFLYECLQKARPLDRSRQPNPSTAAAAAAASSSSRLSSYHRLRQVVETIRASPRSTCLPNKSSGPSRSTPRSIVLTSPHRVLLQPSSLSPSPLAAKQQTAKKRSSLRTAAGETFSSPTVSSSQRAVAANESRFPHHHHKERRLPASGGGHLIQLAVHNQSGLRFATPQASRQASPQRASISTATTPPSEDVDSSSERSCGTTSNRGRPEGAQHHQRHDDGDAGADLLPSDFTTLRLSSTDVSPSSESKSALDV